MITKDKIKEILTHFQKNKEELIINKNDQETEYDFADIGYFEISKNNKSYITDHSGEELVFISNGEILLEDCNDTQRQILDNIYKSFISKTQGIEIQTDIEIQLSEINEKQIEEIFTYFKDNKDKLLVNENNKEIEYDFADIGYYEIKEDNTSYLTNYAGEELVYTNGEGKILIENCTKEQLNTLKAVYNSFTDNKIEETLMNGKSSNNIKAFIDNYPKTKNTKKSNLSR